MFSRSNTCLFSKGYKVQNRAISFASLSDSGSFVERTHYPNSTRERIRWPMRNMPHLIPQIAKELNEVTRQAFLGRALGTEFIEQQLTQTKFLDIYRNAAGQACQYGRLDVYEEVIDQPVSLGMFKIPGYKTEVSNALGQLVLRELSDRVTILNPNPSLLHINCALSPRAYEMTQTISDRTIPNIDLISELGSREEMVKNIRAQVSDAVRRNENIEIVRQYYIKKMEKATGIKLTFLKDESILIGCIPMPEEMISSLHSHKTRTSDIFHKLLNINNGDMFLFYSEISYDGLVEKLKCGQSKLKFS
jgi:hypothetical protein